MKITTPSIINLHNGRISKPLKLFRQIISYLGPGFFVTVGFIDPGNWATNIAAGSTFGYELLWVVMLATLVLILWQHMSAHLGIVTGKCLAEAVHDNISPLPRFIYGFTAMAACSATALAEILGAALGMYMLFGTPLILGSVIATVFVITMIWFQHYKSLEKVIIGFVSAIGFCYLIELILVRPDWHLAAIHSVVPKLNSHSLIIALGVLGAVVMPHNMYLHSEVIQNRQWSASTEEETRYLLKFEFVDTLVAMLVGLAINAAMLIVAAAVFHSKGIVVTDLMQASDTLEPAVGKFAGVLFGMALLFAGLSSSLTAAIAGGSTYSGYLGFKTDLSGKLFRIGLILTIIPACLVIFIIKDTFQALIISQVCLSIQLPLTMLPIYLLTSSSKVMGKFTNGAFEKTSMIITGVVIVLLNMLLLYQAFGGRF